MKAPNCPSCPGGVMLVQEGATLRCPKCRQRYSMPSPAQAAADSIGGESDPSMDETIDTPEHPISRPGAPPAAQGEAMKLPFSEQFMQVYEPVSFLGKGAMGAVYLMRQSKLDRLVAVKVVNAEALSGEVSRRLIQEAKVLASLNHVNIMGIFDVGEDNGLPYMVSEYVEGEPLNERLRRDPPLTLPQCLRIILHILDGLKAAHKQSVVHRDLKPSNVFLTSTGKPKIGDFGLAKSQNAPSGTVAGRILGTPGYMSPEQCRGRAVTPGSDLYAVGIMLFELIAGRRPFQGPQLLDYLRQHTTEPPPRLRDIRPDIPAALDAAVQKALQKDPNDRFKSANEFKKTLQDIYKQLVPSKDGSQSVSKSTWGSVQSGADLMPGAKLADRYELVKLLGHGGMGQVWMAKDEIRAGVKVAVKLLPPELWRDPEARSNLVGEANIALQLSHPDIVRLINIEPGESPFLVMELVLGPTLADELSRRKKLGYGPMKPYETLVVMEAIGRALDYAHDRNVIHRDIKPSNLILTLEDDHIIGAKLADFGIAAELANFKTRVTGAVPAGTLSYMSPEQVACQKLDRRADVYSLGATLFQMLTGHPPYQGDDIAPMIRTAPVPDPEGVPLAVATVVKASLAKDPEGRPATAGELYERLREAVGEGPSGSRPTHKSVAAGRTGDDSHDISLGGQSHPSMPSVNTSPTKAGALDDKSEKVAEQSRVAWVPGQSDCANAQESIVRTPYQLTIDGQLPAGGLDELLGINKPGVTKPKRGVGKYLIALVAAGLVSMGLAWPSIKPHVDAMLAVTPPPTATSEPTPTVTPTTPPSVVSVATVAPPKQPPATGRITIDVGEKGLVVEALDGSRLGETGAPFSLPAGKHTVVIRSVNFEDAQLTVDVAAAAHKTYKPVLNRRAVTVKVKTIPPDAELLVDDQSRGKVGEVSIQAGRNTKLTARLPGYKLATEILNVAANKEKEVSLVLSPEDVEVQITTTPPGAQVVMVNGNVAGVTPLRLTMQPGQNVQYTLNLAGYKPVQITGVTLVGQPLVIGRQLEKIPEATPTPTPASGLSEADRKRRDDRVEFARNLFLKQDYVNAEQALKEVLALDPKHIDTLLMLARVYIASDALDSAEESVRTAYGVDPKRGDVLDLYCAVLMRMQRMAQAEKMARELVSTNPKDPNYVATLAVVLCLQNKHADAKATAESGLKMKPDLATAKVFKDVIKKKCE